MGYGRYSSSGNVDETTKVILKYSTFNAHTINCVGHGYELRGRVNGNNDF